MNDENQDGERTIASWGGARVKENRHLGMLIFLIALAVFFTVGIVCFVIYRFSSPASHSMAPLYLPPAIWLSSLVLALSAFFVIRSTQVAKREDFDELNLWLWRTWAAAGAFVLIQIPALLEMLSIHFEYVKDNRPGIYGISFALILLHALHVIGGIVPITRLAWLSHRGRLDRSHLISVRECAQYWHFLEIVWILLLLMFLVA